jgi:hypothetical protein
LHCKSKAALEHIFDRHVTSFASDALASHGRSESSLQAGMQRVTEALPLMPRMRFIIHIVIITTL